MIKNKILLILMCFMLGALNASYCVENTHIKNDMAKQSVNKAKNNTNDDFAKKLNLTNEQILQIKKNNETSRQKIEQIRQENRRAFEAILTLEQKQKLQEMKKAQHAKAKGGQKIHEKTYKETHKAKKENKPNNKK